MTQAGVDLIRIEGGKIVEVKLFSNDQAQEDAFWGRDWLLCQVDDKPWAGWLKS